MGIHLIRNHTISDPERPLGMSGPTSFYRWEREKDVSKVVSLMGWDGTKASQPQFSLPA